jgi:hypothetical protein
MKLLLKSLAFTGLTVFLLGYQPRLIAQPTVTFHSDFEGGSLGEVTKVGENHWRCAIEGESDWDNRNRQASWYYFQMQGAENQPIVLELTKLLGEYNYKPGAHAITSETRPVISYDQIEWRHLTDEEVRWNEEATELILNFTPATDTVWVAHMPPYLPSDLDKLLADYQDHPSLSKNSIGTTPQGRSLWQLTISKPKAQAEDKKEVWLMARQHSWEAGTSWAMEGIIRYLLDSAEANGLLDQIIFQIIPMADPDGVARGGVRFNEFGHDVNRNWDFVIADEMPEIQAQKTVIAAHAGQIDLFITLHNTERADYLQGPDLAVGQKLWQAMVDNTSFESDEGVRPMPRTTTEGKKGRMTVNQALWAEYQIPAYLMELKVEHVNKLPGRRLPSDWQTLGRGLVKSIGELWPEKP